MKKVISFISISLMTIILGGCSLTGLTVSTHQTNVGLNKNNYRIIATNITGEATSKGVLGVSYGLGIGASQFALVPLSQDRTLYTKAMQNLWANFEIKSGKSIDRTLALVNVRYDSEVLNTLFYTKLKVVVVADVIEFK